MEIYIKNLLSSFTELINNHLSSRLPPVPEEGADDGMFGRNDVYGFSMMGKQKRLNRK